jgi:surface polysaccharide O-acyltransferase-like enzyme
VTNLEGIRADSADAAVLPASAVEAAAAGSQRVVPSKRAGGFSHPINHMRGLAIIPIVAGHCYNAFDWRAGTLGSHLTAVWSDLNIFFIFISGYLFQFLLGRFVYPKYLRAKLRNVLLPYLIMSVPALILYGANLKAHPHFADLFATMPVLQRLAVLVLTGAQMGPYWFIPMMAVFYLLAPLLAAIDRTPATYAVIAPLFVCAITIVPRPLYDLQPLQSALHYLPIYMLGMLISHYHARIIPVLTRHWLAMVMLSAMLFGVILYADYASVLFDRLPITTVFCLTLLAVLSRFTTQPVPALDLLARYAFGIFFVHAYYVAAVRVALTRWPALAEGGQPKFLLTLLMVMALTMATVWLVRRLFPGRSRMLIGS